MTLSRRSFGALLVAGAASAALPFWLRQRESGLITRLGDGDETDALIQIGGANRDRFVPNINVSKWGDESFLNLNFEQFTTSEARHDRNAIVASAKDAEIVFHRDGPGALEAGVLLHRYPSMDAISLRVDSSDDVRFAYQGELTEHEIAEKCHRPKKVIGSYAVLCDKKNNQYKTGKIAHLFRWRCTDAKGQVHWCAPLRFDGKSMKIGLPMDWLKRATFPVYVGSPATVGFTSIAGTSKGISNHSYGWAVTLTEDGDFTDMDVYGNSTVADDITLGIISENGAGGAPLAVLRDSGGGASPTVLGWTNQTLDSTLSLTNGDRVYLCCDNDTDFTMYFDNDAGEDDTYRRVTGYNSGQIDVPNSLIALGGTPQRWSIYATYTATGGGSAVPKIIQQH